MKKLLLILVLTAILINGGAYAAVPEYSVTVKTGTVNFTDVKPKNIENVTYIPLRAVFEKLGCEVTWDSNTGTVTIKKGKTLLLYPASGSKLLINGEEKSFNNKGVILNNRLLVPMEFFSTLGMEVSQNSNTISLICKSCNK